MGTEEEPPLFTPHWDPDSSLVRVGKGGQSPWISHGGLHGQPANRNKPTLKGLLVPKDTCSQSATEPREFGNSPGSFPGGLLCLSHKFKRKKKVIQKNQSNVLTGMSRREDEQGQGQRWACVER